jgi:biopolymer transport protein ExbB
MFELAKDLMRQGGWAMWPLLVLSLVSVTLCTERSLFWIRLHRPGVRRWLRFTREALRKGDATQVELLCARGVSLYAAVASAVLARHDEPAVIEAIEETRLPLERFGTTLSTIIAAAPLLGILGTVTGIIRSFDILGQMDTGVMADPAAVASGIAEALLTTAFGLIIATATLFPYAWFRANVTQSISAMESLAAAAQQGGTPNPKQ